MSQYICKSCNEEFNNPEKTNKFLKIIGLFFLYLLLTFIFFISIFLIWAIWPLWLIFIVHIIVVIVKDQGRGKCPNCESEDFISTESIEGQTLVNKIRKQKQT